MLMTGCAAGELSEKRNELSLIKLAMTNRMNSKLFQWFALGALDV
jgi:hypothetical protein